MHIDQRAAIVTGGASGLGAATARLLADKGAKVTLFGLNADAGEALAREIRGLFQSVNVTDEASVLDGLVTARAVHGTARTFC